MSGEGLDVSPSVGTATPTLQGSAVPSLSSDPAPSTLVTSAPLSEPAVSTSSDPSSSPSLSSNTVSTPTVSSVTSSPSSSSSPVSSGSASSSPSASSSSASQTASAANGASSGTSSSPPGPSSATPASSFAAPANASSESPIASSTTSSPQSPLSASSSAPTPSPSTKTDAFSSQNSQSSAATSRATSSTKFTGVPSSTPFPTDTVIGAGASTGIFSTDSNADPPLVTGSSIGNGAAAHGKLSPGTLAAILVPILLVALVLIPLLAVVLRNRRKRVRFMSTYEDLTGHDTSDAPRTLQTSGRGVSWAESADSESQWDMCSIPSASSRVHLDILARRASSVPSQYSHTSNATDPFGDTDEAPLVAGSSRSASKGSRREGAGSRAGGGSVSPSSLASKSKVWARALTPTSRKAAFSPVPSDYRGTPGPARSNSRHSHLRDDSMEEVDITLSPTSRSIMWEQADDPFANPNQRSFD